VSSVLQGGRSAPRGTPPRRRLAALLLALAVAAGVLLVVILAGGGGDKEPATQPTPAYPAKPAPERGRVAPRWRELARAMAAPWVRLQRPDGRFPDYTDRYIRGLPDTRYGEAVLGYALVQTGVREGDNRLLDAGLKALAYVANRPGWAHHRASVFEDMAMAAAYNLVRRRIPDHPLFRSNRRAWEGFLRKVRPVSTPYRVPRTRRYSNHFLVEAIGVLELLKTGLRSSRPGATLGGKRALAAAVTYRLLNEQVPGFAQLDRVNVAGEPTFILSDPPDNPLAYQGFSVGFYARALRALGANDSPAARVALRGAVNASLDLTAPDGDLAYFGRSQEEAWALAATANGAATAARLDGSPRSADRAYRALADRALKRLESAYGVGPEGLYIVPALRADMKRGARGLDVNAGSPSFAGVTLMTLNWALDSLPRRTRRGRIGSDADGVTALSQGESHFAVVRRGPVWFAVRQTRSVRRREDLRYDFGLVALKVRGEGGWRDVLRLRPRRLDGPDSAGPSLVLAGVRGLPYGTALSPGPGGSVDVAGGWTTGAGAILRSGVVFNFRPTRCGVRISWPAQGGDRFDFSFFMRRAAAPRPLGRFILADRDETIAFNTPARVRTEGAYSSAVDPVLVRARTLLSASRTQTMRVTVCRP
jgi:hypothetical protein